jgi:hypothetical protein
MPLDLECLHEKDSAEISGAYRKIHLSDILSAASELINLYHRRSTPQALTPEQREELVRNMQDAYNKVFQDARLMPVVYYPAMPAALAVAEKRLVGKV